MTSLLSSILTKGVGRGEERGGEEQIVGERKVWDLFRERSSTFSLEFQAIGPSIFDEARSKVSPHGKGYAWVHVLWSFDKLQEVGVFSYSVIFGFKSRVNGLVDLRP